jgi:hypothetical protein
MIKTTERVETASNKLLVVVGRGGVCKLQDTLNLSYSVLVGALATQTRIELSPVV